jgi:hypothetical protein
MRAKLLLIIIFYSDTSLIIKTVIYVPIDSHLPVAVAERFEAWTVFDRSEAVIAGSDPALGMDV